MNQYLESDEKIFLSLIESIARSDPREKTQNILKQSITLDQESDSIIQSIYQSDVNISGEQLQNIKKALIKKYCSEHIENLSSFYLADSIVLIDEIDPLIAKNQLLLLKNDILEFYTMGVNYPEYGIDKHHPCFPADSNHHVIFLGRYDREDEDEIDIISITHDNKIIPEHQYRLLSKDRFRALIFTASDVANAKGEYTLTYKHSNIYFGHGAEISPNKTAYFIIE